MQTYITSPPAAREHRDDIAALRKAVKHALRGHPPLPGAFPALFRELTPFFPLHHLLVTYTTGAPSEETYYFHPDPAGGRRSPGRMHTTQEQIHVLDNGPERVVRVGNHGDHSIIIGLLGQLLPSTPFSALIIRLLSPERVICALTLVFRGVHQAYDARHAALAFALFDILDAYFRAHAAGALRKKAPPPDDMRLLPLTSLPGMAGVNELIWRVARQDCPVLLLGETGTGKEAVADAIYRGSARVHGPFVKVNCGCLPDTLIDSELFGHERGAFTGAERTVKGRFERADRGVLLLDEVGEMPLQAQTRLLRVLQEGVIERVGGEDEQRVDVRVVAATHRNLLRMVREGRFREDLYYRLDVFPLRIPPLRERPEDIPLLAAFFIRQKCVRQGVSVPPAPERRDMEALVAHAWPGNIRELNNVVERAVILWLGDMRRPFRLRLDGSEAITEIPPVAVPARFPARPAPAPDDAPCPLDEAVVRHIRRALEHCHGKISGPGGAAELLRVHPNTLRAKMTKLGLRG